ncbi:MAG: ABC transporter permease, partial [Mesorhizobium sp.]
LCIIFGTLRGDVFFSSRNILNIGLAVTILGVLAMSQTVVIVAGGLDVSVGSTVGFATVATAMVAQSTGSAAVAVVAGLLIGAACGLVNGIIITYGRVNAVIATLGTMAI